MEHPYNIQPLGNIYHSKDNGKIKINIPKRRDGSLGTFLSKLNDSIIYNTFFGYFNAKDLGIIASVSNYFYVLSHDRDYWKEKSEPIYRKFFEQTGQQGMELFLLISNY